MKNKRNDKWSVGGYLETFEFNGFQDYCVNSGGHPAGIHCHSLIRDMERRF